MSLCRLRIAEDGVWNPYQPHHVAVQSEYFHCAVESKATIGPGLSKKYVNLVFLKENDRTGRQPMSECSARFVCFGKSLLFLRVFDLSSHAPTSLSVST